MTPDQAADLAARILAAIDAAPPAGNEHWLAADRERVGSDLAAVQGGALCDEHSGGSCYHDHSAPIDGLRRTAALYGVTP